MTGRTERATSDFAPSPATGPRLEVGSRVKRGTPAEIGAVEAPTAVSATIPCPSCHGKGESFAFVNTGPDSSKHYCGMVECDRCKGAGSVPEQMTEWIRAGAEFRSARIAEGLYMHAVAERLGVSVPSVSKAYNGLVDPAPLMEAWGRLDTGPQS